ncbi:MAG: type transport system permease protein [Actinomycetota bacterium]|jgi:ABC-type transport system involved in multi-copper enzyme maturation permease subunit|nr:type transport system permease protein [Actinomycetota bacterium]
MSGIRVTPVRVMLSEWTKLRTLRSTVWALLAAVAFLIGFAVLVPEVVVHHWPPTNPRDAATFDPVGASLVGGFFAQLAFGVLGVLFITGEYATGMIRATLSAVPKRIPVLWAKALVYGVTCLVLASGAQLSAFLIGQAILSSKGIDIGFGDEHVARAVLGGALYLTGVGLLGLGLGALLRNTAAAITSLFGLLFVVSIVVHFLPASWSDAIEKYLPSNAGTVITSLRPDPNTLGPWTGLLVFFLYAVVALALAGVALVRRDA